MISLFDKNFEEFHSGETFSKSIKGVRSGSDQLDQRTRTSFKFKRKFDE